jgi:hypothetical protein
MRRTTMLWEVYVTRFEEAFGQYRRRRLNAEEAGELLGVSGRHFRRLCDRYEEEGSEGLRDRRIGKVSPRRAPARELEPDGAGLYLQVSPAGTKSWVFRYSTIGRERYMGLGPFPDVSLADARAAANDCRKLRRQDIDPIEHRAGQRAEALLAAAATKTFRECASVNIESKKDGWKNAKHAAQWTATLETYAYPVIGDLPVLTVDTGLVEKVLKPIWASKTETASRDAPEIKPIP